jgi:hypothetical protein
MADDWHLLSPAHAPSPRYGHGLTYDNFRNRAVLFGGSKGGVPFASDETWLWDGSDWTQAAPATVPGARSGMGFAMAFALGKAIMFGGYDGSSSLTANNETWSWDGSDWTLEAPGASPSARFFPVMGYDIGLGLITVFGGRDTAGNGIRDTWTYDGTTWTQELPVSGPVAALNRSHTLGFNAFNNQVLLFGHDTGGLPAADTWLHGGAGWTQQFPATVPSGRETASIERYPANGTMMFGGDDSITMLNDTWFWSGTNWSQASPAHSPSARELCGMAYVSSGGYMLLFGGDTGGPTRNGETWLYGGTLQSYEVALGYGGVAPQGGADRTNPGYLQSALPALDLTPGCKVKLRAQDAAGSLRSNDSWSDVRLWVDDGS